MPSSPSAAASAPPRLRAKYFRYTPDVNERIRRWAESEGIASYSIVPLFFEEEEGEDDDE